jgi:hypothetical protein
MKFSPKDIFSKKIIKVILGIDIAFLFILIPFGYALAKEPNKISLLIYLLFDFITIFLFIFSIHINRKYITELRFEIQTIILMGGSFLGMILFSFLIISDLLIGSIFLFLFINLFFISLYTRIYLWEKYDNVKKKINKKKKKY